MNNITPFTFTDTSLFLHLYRCQPGNNDEEDSEDDDCDADADDALREDNSSKMEVDAPQIQSSLNRMDTTNGHPSSREAPEVVDGWTVVSSRRGKGRRN